MIVRLRSLKFDSPACDKNEHYSLNTNDNIFLYRIGHQQVDFGGFLRFRWWIWKDLGTHCHCSVKPMHLVRGESTRRHPIQSAQKMSQIQKNSKTNTIQKSTPDAHICNRNWPNIKIKEIANCIKYCFNV